MGTGFEVGADTSGSTRETTRGTVGSALGADERPRVNRIAPYQKLADSDRGTAGLSLADFLGYFAIGLGLAEVLAPNAMAKIIGVKEPDETTKRTMQLMGLREIGSGVAILSSQQPAKAV